MMQTENNQNIFNRIDALTFEEIQASTDLSGKIASANALKTVGEKLVHLQSYYDGDKFPIYDYPSPRNDQQVTSIVRNMVNGALYVLWYDRSVTAFILAYIISGSVPSLGDSVIIQYFS